MDDVLTGDRMKEAKFSQLLWMLMKVSDNEPAEEVSHCTSKEWKPVKLRSGPRWSRSRYCQISGTRGWKVEQLSKGHNRSWSSKGL